jgi:lipopolysaccharide export system protein LptA
VRKLLFFFIITGLLPFSLLAQKRTKITIDHAKTVNVDNKKKVTYLKNPVFRQDNATLTCDSAILYDEKNMFEAYNNVHINQADTINIYSDRLTYEGNTKMAHLSSNVRLLDRESVLTTNILDYNMATKVGTYVEGGKIVNKDVTLTSKNGYYFAGTRDSYFRYNVVVVTPQTTIKSDTMRYNTLTNWTYFYGPTNIKGKDDNLYTENGAYNTKTEYAYFGKKNLYTSGSKSLKGDSLYYDGKIGYGKAVRNIVFKDTVDKTTMYGQLGYYYKIDQRTLVTKNAYVGLGTSDSVLVKNVKRPDTLWMGADTLETQIVLRQTLKLLPLPIIKKDNEVGEEKPKEKPKGKPLAPASGVSGRPIAGQKKELPKKGAKDSRIAAPWALKISDSLTRKKIPWEPSSRKMPELIRDKPPADPKKTNVRDASGVRPIFPSVKKDSLQQSGLQNPSAALKKVIRKDTIPLNPLDTVKARIIRAYHHVKVFKSNMQAKADSLFYTSADSTLRWYYNPIMWAEGSQQTGDTLYLHMRDKKLNSVQVIRNGFTVNVYKDSLKFNQIKGRLMTGFFKDGKLKYMYVDGNAESLYYTKDDKDQYEKMNRTISARIKILFKGNEIDEIVPIKDVEGTTTPIGQVKENVTLTGFIWKPELRPLSKLDITNPKARPKTKAAADPKKKNTDKDGLIKALGKEAGNVPQGVKKQAEQIIKSAAADSTLKPVTLIKPGVKTDSLLKKIPLKTDTLIKPAPLKKQ